MVPPKSQKGSYKDYVGWAFDGIVSLVKESMNLESNSVWAWRTRVMVVLMCQLLWQIDDSLYFCGQSPWQANHISCVSTSCVDGCFSHVLVTLWRSQYVCYGGLHGTNPSAQVEVETRLRSCRPLFYRSCPSTEFLSVPENPQDFYRIF